MRFSPASRHPFTLDFCLTIPGKPARDDGVEKALTSAESFPAAMEGTVKIGVPVHGTFCALNTGTHSYQATLGVSSLGHGPLPQYRLDTQ